MCLLCGKRTTAVDATPSPDVDQCSPKGGVPQCTTMPSLQKGVAVAVHAVETFISPPRTVPTSTVAQSPPCNPLCTGCHDLGMDSARVLRLTRCAANAHTRTWTARLGVRFAITCPQCKNKELVLLDTDESSLSFDERKWFGEAVRRLSYLGHVVVPKLRGEATQKTLSIRPPAKATACPPRKCFCGEACCH